MIAAGLEISQLMGAGRSLPCDSQAAPAHAVALHQPASRPGGLCPQCLLRLGLGVDFSAAAAARVLDALTPRTVRCHGSCSASPGPEAAPSRWSGPLARDARPGRPPGRACSSSARSPAAAWGRCSRAATPTSAATWPSRSSWRSTATSPSWSAGSSRRRRSAASSSTPASCPSTSWAPSPTAGRIFAMKLVKGRTLAAPAGRPATTRPTSLPRFLAIFEQVCQTVAYAHARGVIHRDLKPSNVMVGSFGEVQVMDWGLAKVLPRGGRRRRRDGRQGRATETVIATARQRLGRRPVAGRLGDGHAGATWRPSRPGARSSGVDERADVFALGSILCEILTGQPAFTGHSSRRDPGARPPRGDLADALARLDACGADAELVALARDCLAAGAEDRPRDAGAVADRVTAHLAGVQERLRAAELARVEAQAPRRRGAEATLADAVARGLDPGYGTPDWRRLDLDGGASAQAAGGDGPRGQQGPRRGPRPARPGPNGHRLATGLSGSR